MVALKCSKHHVNWNLFLALGFGWILFVGSSMVLVQQLLGRAKRNHKFLLKQFLPPLSFWGWQH